MVWACGGVLEGDFNFVSTTNGKGFIPMGIKIFTLFVM